jgi:preprotein translocase subunit SecD
MPNKFPLWKNITILLVVTFGFVFAAPNLYPPDPAIQLSGQSGAMQIDAAVLQKVEQSLDEAGIAHFAGESDSGDHGWRLYCCIEPGANHSRLVA